MESESNMVNLHKLKLGAEKLEALTAAIDAVDEATLAIEGAKDGIAVLADSLTNINLVADLALTYKNSAEASATTATTQAGIATTKASEAAASAILAESYANIYAIDATPTDGSANAVSSNAVFDGLASKLNTAGGTMTGAITALRETKVAMGANDIDLSLGNLFTKNISGATTLTVSNILTTGNANSFILELTNGGSSAITYPSGSKFAGGTAPTLTASGKDILGCYSHDGGTTLNWIVLGKDVK